MSTRVSALMMVGVLAGCSVPDSWQGTVYPNRQNLKDAVSLGSFSSSLRCAVASVDVLARLDALKTGDYECGHDCKRDERLPGLFVCDTTDKPIDPSLLPSGPLVVVSLHEQCMARVSELHRPEFLTLPGQLKVKTGISAKEEIDSYVAFTEAVACLGETSTDIVPRLDMAPTEFRVYFNQHAKALGIDNRISLR